MAIDGTLTTLQQASAAVSDALEAAKTELNSVLAQIETLEASRQATVTALPHTDDISAVLVRGVNQSATAYERDLTTYLRDTFAPTGLGADTSKAAAAVQGNGQRFLSIGTTPLDIPGYVARARPDGGLPDMPLHFGAVTYFLRDKLLAEIPGLVDRLCPAARTGMKGADRTAAIAALDAQLTTLRTRRDQLQSEIAAARKALGVR
ncbi:hypothetical protein [Sphingomonas melonis]|uniref:hypothetical protein n=1 Tax=Sphingomonas melonis TaxID=152682 RepID=UPI0035C878D7